VRRVRRMGWRGERGRMEEEGRGGEERTSGAAE
jgi:hypothetical protein